VDLALQLLDDSSLGKDIKLFSRTKQMLSNALKGSVDSAYILTKLAHHCDLFLPEHARAFNNSLAHHASLLNHLGATQTQITETRTSIQEAKDSLSSKRADLVQLWSRGQMLEEMMRILDQMCVCPFNSSYLIDILRYFPPSTANT
jgi:exocyst complex component 4